MFTNDDLFIDEPIAPVPQQEGKVPFAECWRCPLKDAPCVPTHRPQGEATLVVVGEAPGFYEVKAGKPFVGPSGQLLDYVLQQVHINPASVVRTNAVLCRPQDNEQPPRQALEACQRRLQAELSEYPTASVVALGASALASLRGSSRKDQGILKSRGQWQRTTTGREFMPTLHPAFILRPNGSGYYNTLLNDFRSLAVDRSKDWLSTVYYEMDRGWSTQLDLIPNSAKLSYDVETTGLDAHSADLLCLAIAVDTHAAYIFDPYSLKCNRGNLQRLFNRCKPIAHNGKFDNNVLARYGIEVTQADDTMLAHYALDETKGTHGLKQLATTYLGVPDYEKELVDKHFKTTKREARDYSKIPQADLYRYVAIDVCATLALNEVLQPLIDQDNVRQAYNILIDASNALGKAERKGIKIDRPYLEKVLEALLTALAENEQKVQSAASEATTVFIDKLKSHNWRNPDPSWIKGETLLDQYHKYLTVLNKIAYGDKKHTGVNLKSWPQMQVLLYDVLGLTHQKQVGFKTKPRSTNAEALDALAPLNHPFVKILQEYRRLDKIRSTYVEPLLRMADDNDRVHVNFLLHGTETGRLSASDSLHGIPRPSDIWGQAIRGAFIAGEGKKLIIADYSQAELRCFAAESKEPFLLDKYNNDQDVHTETAILLFGDRFLNADKDEKKELRTIAKNVNFGGLVYLGGASGIVAMIRAQTGMDITETQVKPVLEALKAKMPTAAKWQREQFAFAKNYGYVQSRFGNKRRFPLITDDLLDEIRKASVNMPIQNAASQLTLLSAVELTRLGLDVLHLVHDSIIVECDEDKADRVKDYVEHTMVTIGERYFPEVKWKADCEIVDRWYEKRPNF